MRKLLIGLALIAFLLVGADFGGRYWAQYRAGLDLRESFGLSRPPSVSMGSFPFLPRYLSGELPLLTVDGSNVNAEGLSLDTVHLLLRKVRFEPRRLLLSQPQRIRASSGKGTITLTGRAVTAAVRREGLPLRVEFKKGKTLVSSDALAADIEADLSLSGDSLLVRPADLSLPVSATVPLPEVLPGLRYTGVRVERSTARLSFTLQRPSFEVK